MIRHYLPIFLFLLGFSYCNGQTFVHPGVPFTTQDLNALKANVGQQPWAAGYQALQGDYRSQLTYNGSPKITVGRAPDLNRNFFINDMTAVHNLAFMWVFTENPAYAQKATAILDAWATTNTQWTGDETFLDLGDYAPYYTTGADILRSTYPGWTTQNSQHVDNWFRNVLWPQADVPNPVRGHNQGAIQLKFAIGIAAYLGDADLWEKAVGTYRKDAGGGLANSLSNGEVGDSGRDMGHWLGQVEALIWSAEVAWKQGIDLFSEYDNRLLAAAELLSAYRSNPASYSGQFIPFGGTYAYYGGWASGSTTTASIYYNIIHNAYAVRKGIPTPASDVYRNSIAENGFTFLFRKNADASTAWSLPGITYPGTAGVSLLTSADVGQTGLSGTTAFNGGQWQLNAAGQGVPVPASQGTDSFRYGFKQLTGEGAIVAKITANGGQAGIMFREDLTENSRFVSIMLSPGGGVVLTHRNATAWSKTNISWNNPPGGYQSHGVGPLPWWLKLERRDGRIYGFHSGDGEHWTCIGIVVSPLAPTAYAGIYAASGSTSARAVSIFSDVSITSGAAPGAPEITGATTAAATLGSTFQYAITANGSPTSFSAQGFPAGLSVNEATGLISGAPTVTGSFLVTISAANADGTDTALVWINVGSNQAPAAPQGLLLANTGVKKVTLSWEAVPGAQTYAVKHSLNAGGPYETILSGVTAHSIDDTDAFPGNNFYVISAFSGALESVGSDEGHILLPPDIPQKPIIISGNGQLQLNWPQAIGATAYNVRRSTASGGPYTVIATDWEGTSYLDQNLTNGHYYFYVVSSVLDNLESLDSPEEMGVPGADSSAWAEQPSSNLWSVGANWDPNTPPASPALLSFGPSTITSLNNDLTGIEAARILFAQGAGAYTISGNAIAFGNEIVNMSSNEQVIGLAGSLSRPLYIKSNAGGIRLTGILTGSGKIVKQGSSSITLSGNNTYSGGTEITGSTGGWTPNAPFNITGEGQGTDGSPTSGPLGTGVVTLNGGALRNSGYARIFNTIYVAPGTSNFLYSEGGALSLSGAFTGSGTLTHDGNSYDAINIAGDNSQFSGRFVSVNRSSWSRLRFNNASSGSALAHWELNSTFSDAHRFSFNGTMELGALSGTGLLNTYNAPILRIGARNEGTIFSGIMTATNISIEKVGTGYLKFTGNNLNNGTTRVFEGALYINGQYASASTANAGILGGSGTISAPVVIGTGSGNGAWLAPGDQGVGTLTISNTLTLNQDATLTAEFNPLAQVADAVSVTAITLNSPVLLFVQAASGSIPAGTNFTLVNNTGSQPVSGTFLNLPEMALVNLGTFEYFITYTGGNGNDIVLLDKRTTPALISSANTASGIRNTAFAYQITAVNNPTSFSASGLPQGLSVDAQTGLISGIPAVSGVFPVVIGAENAVGASTLALTLTIMTNEVPEAPLGLAATVISSTSLKLDWEPLAPGMFVTGYTVKRSGVPGGPYSVIAQEITASDYTDANLQQNTQYYYVVSASNSVGEGQNSSEATANTPMPPIAPQVTGIAAVGSNNKVTLTWKSAFEAASYNIYRSTAAIGPFSLIGNVQGLVYENTGLTNGAAYYYYVTAVNSTGENNPSATVSATPDGNAFARWAFDESGGTVATDVWNGKIASIQQNTYEWQAGVLGNALHLQSTSFVALPSGIANTLGNFTISTWVKLDINAAWQRVFDFGNGSATNMFLTTNAGSNVVRFAIKNNNSAEQQLNATFPMSVGSWYHIAITRSGNAARLYINGSQVAINNGMTLAPSAMGSTPQNWIGKSQYSDPVFKGSIDDFRIYSRALSAAEISQITSVVAPAAPLNLVAAEEASGVGLQWNAVDQADSYSVYRGTAEGVYTVIASNITTTSYTDASVLPAGDNYYVITAVRNGIAGAYSNVAAVASPAAVPANFKATGWNNRADLSWSAASGADNYSILRSGTENGTYVPVATVTATIYQDVSATNSTAYFYKVAANNGSHASTTDALGVTPQLTALSATWSHTDIGAAGVPGNAVPGVTTQALFASGADIWGNADAFHYLYTPLTGNAVLIVRVTSLQNTNASAKAGLMIRESLAANARHVTLDVKPAGGGTELISRAATGGASLSAGTPGSVPQWIKLVRNGNTFTAYTSANGTNWTSFASQAVTMGSSVYVGLIACSHNNTVLATGEFDNFQLITPPDFLDTASEVVVGTPYSYQLAAANTPSTYTANGLPVGLSINTATGLISGVPLHQGTYDVTVTASNEAGSDTGTLTVVVQPFNMSVLYGNGDGNPTNNTIKPYFKIVNNSGIVVSYQDLKVRYWLTPENFAGIASWIDYAQLGGSHIASNYVILDHPRQGALGYIEYSFDPGSGTLNSGSDSGIIQSRLANINWSLLTETDDYSYLPGNVLVPNTAVTLYRNGYLIWGAEPDLIPEQTDVRAIAQNINVSASTNTIQDYLRIENAGNTSIDYRDLTIRYWFTNEGNANLNYWIDYAQMGNSKVNGAFTSGNFGDGANAYLEFGFNPSAGALYPLSNSGNIQFRIAKSDWSAFNQNNDHSFSAAPSMVENQKITIYYQGTLIYGQEPGQSSAARMAGPSGTSATNLPGLSLYPNPVTDQLQVVVQKEGRTRLEVYDLTGKQLLTKDLDTGQTSIDMAGFAAGVYTVIVSQENDRSVHKVVKK